MTNKSLILKKIEETVKKYHNGENKELLSEYGDTKIALMVRDPLTLFAYWEIAAAIRKKYNLLRNETSNELVLRLYDVRADKGGKPAHYLDVKINNKTDNWYVTLPEANRTWIAHLGFYDEENKFVEIARSNKATTPPDSVSKKSTQKWFDLSNKKIVKNYSVLTVFTEPKKFVKATSNVYRDRLCI